jgi:hypothetical protein
MKADKLCQKHMDIERFGGVRDLNITQQQQQQATNILVLVVTLCDSISRQRNMMCNFKCAPSIKP